jgi:hypothetical protein
VVARVAGTHALLYRLGFQLGAALAVAGALWLLWRATESTRSVALLALHPVVAVTIVNGGHNDAFVGLSVLAAVLFARQKRHLASGSALALGALVKLPAVLALLPLCAWVWRRRGARAALETAAPIAVLSLLPLAMIPGAFHSVATADAGIVSRSSVWNVALQLRRSLAPAWGGSLFTPAITKSAIAAVVTIGAVAAWRAVRVRSRLDRGVTIATASWLFAGAYALPWYAGWSLPVAALQPTSALTSVIALQAGFLGASQMIRRGVLPEHPMLAVAVHFVFPVLGLLAFSFAALGRRTRAGLVAWGRAGYRGAAPGADATRLDSA